MYGITFGNKHSKTDWDIILTKVNINQPKPVRYTVTVPGRNGTLDLTASVTPDIKYEDRNLSFAFQLRGDPDTWDAKIQTIMAYVHGKRMHVILDSDPSWYWDGFCTVSWATLENGMGNITINVVASPYKLKNVITERDVELTGTEQEITLANSRMRVSPIIETDAEITVEFDDLTLTLAAGIWTNTGIILEEGNNTITLNGTADVTISYREGAL